MIANGDIPTHNRLPTSSGLHRCHEGMEQSFLEGTLLPEPVEVVDEIYERLLFPSVDLVCLFAADIGGTDNAV